MFPCVALQDKMWNGESMEISKCLRLDGSLSSILESRSTIYKRVSVLNRTSQLGGNAYLDPVIDLDVFVGGVKM